MQFHDDNQYESKKELFEKKYGKLSSSYEIKEETKIDKIIIENNDKEKKEEKVEEEEILKKKRKRHDSSDEEEDDKKNDIPNNSEIDKKQDFIEDINNLGQNENKDSWKKGLEDINNQKNEINEASKMLDDPMRHLLSKNKIIDEMNDLIKKRGFYLPKCKYPPTNNRFGIKPGYRWDGVNRSNGFENKYLNLYFNINKD